VAGMIWKVEKDEKSQILGKIDWRLINKKRFSKDVLVIWGLSAKKLQVA
jgi:hypothetical protein